MIGENKRIGPFENIIIFRALHLGDLLCAVPAMRAIRAAHPESQISLIGLPWAHAFVSRYRQYLDRLILFPGYPGLPEIPPDLSAIPEFIKQIQQVHADLILQMHGSGNIVNPMVSLFGAKQTAGYFQPGSYCPNKETYIEYPEKEPEIWRHLRLVEHLGIPFQGDHLEFPVYELDDHHYQRIRSDYSIDERGYVCIHPGSRAVERRWSPSNFARIGDALHRKGFQVVLTGTKEERHLTEAVATAMKQPVIDLTGKTDLGSLALLIEKSRLLVCNDTGVSHVADAMKAPSVVIFSASDPERWAPFDRDLHRIVYLPGGPDPELVWGQVEQMVGSDGDHAN